MKRFSLFCIVYCAVAAVLYASEVCTVTETALVPEPFTEAHSVPDYESGAIQTHIEFPHLLKDSIAYIDVPWNPQWIGAESAFLYHHGIARVACALASASYGKITDSGSVTGLSATYHALGFAQSSIEYHYNTVYDDEEWGVDQTSFSFAQQTVRTDSGAVRTVVAIVIRGTPLNKEEWISNANVADSLSEPVQKKQQRIVPTEHEGFAKATQQVYAAFLRYLAQYHLNPADIYVLVTGHSRGASVSNLLAVALPEAGIAAERIYAYTFAAPNVTRAQDVWNEKYGYIWNIVNQEDLVPTVPFESNAWGYRKYGHILPIASYFSTPDIYTFSEHMLPAMNNVYRVLMERDYAPFKTGNFVPYVIAAVSQLLDKDVIAYYSGGRAMHDPLVAIFSKIFSMEIDDPLLAIKEQSGLLVVLLNMLEEQYPGITEKAAKALYDMHGAETYFAWMLSASPEQLFKTCDTYLLRCSGRAEVLVTDAAGTLCARVINGIPEKFIQMGEIPVFKLPAGDICIGIPGNRAYTLTISHDSVLPSSVELSIETILGSGTVQKKVAYPSLSVHWLKLFTYTFEAETEEALQKINGIRAAKTARQNFTHEFHLKPVFCADTDWNMGIGMQASFVYGYGLLEVKTNTWKQYNAVTLAPGIGVRSNIIDAFYVGLLAQWQFALDLGDTSQRLTHVPAAAVTFAYQPRKDSRIFVAASADFGFWQWNEHAFSDTMRPNRNHVKLSSDGSVFCVPQLRFGVAF